MNKGGEIFWEEVFGAQGDARREVFRSHFSKIAAPGVFLCVEFPSTSSTRTKVYDAVATTKDSSVYLSVEEESSAVAVDPPLASRHHESFQNFENKTESVILFPVLLVMSVVQILWVAPRMQLRDIPETRSLQTEQQAASSIVVTDFTANQIMAAVLKQLRSTAAIPADDDRNLQTSVNSSHIQQQQQQESTSYIHDFAEGELNVEPALPRECVSLRFRGDPHHYPVEEAIELLRTKYEANPGPRSLRLGILIMEEVEKFFPVRIRATGNNYHLYHFMEFLVMAYATLHQIASALPAVVVEETAVKDNALATTATATTTATTTTLTQGNPVVTVPWIFSPYMTPTEICGGPQSLNCLAADLTLRASSHSIFQDQIRYHWT